MSLIPEHPKEQLLFFFDNPLVAGEPGGNKLIDGFLELVAPLIGLRHGGDDSASLAGLFDTSLSAPAPSPSGDAGSKGGSGGHHGGDGQANAALVTVLGLVGGLARGDLDL